MIALYVQMSYPLEIEGMLYQNLALLQHYNFVSRSKFQIHVLRCMSERFCKENDSIAFLKRNKMIATEATNEDEILASDVAIEAEDTKQSVGHLDYLV
ncbi:hypothetical protein A0J61_09491 [Choanephora cucurbitarum]|uniref:Uncharacterized protein n=1 Tax=Choanephora cucurbitarum TaxID=101091 RepID=A0A1C7N0B7_9FUNG|nr:hypothetical protein A0J61_09491 [Choanephora cucurbitarum]